MILSKAMRQAITCINILFIGCKPLTKGGLNVLDWYLLISLVFVFGTLVELAIALLTKQTLQILVKGSNDKVPIAGDRFNCKLQDPKIRATIHKNSSMESCCLQKHLCQHPMSSNLSENGREKDVAATKGAAIMQTVLDELSITNKIDILAFIVFNLTYITFNIIYFCTL